MKRRIRGSRRVWVGLASLLGFALAAAPCGGQERPEPRIARLVERLGSDSYAERVAANQQLAELGAKPRAELELAARSPDAEVAARARQLLQKIALDDLWLASRVTYAGANAPSSTVLGEISRQTGNRLLFGDRYGGFNDGPLEFAAADETFWEALDGFCRRTRHTIRPHYDTREPGLAVVSGEPGAFPIAYAGPVRAVVTGALRTFSDEFDYKRLTSKQNHNFRFNLELMWEDRLRVVAYRNQATVVEAVAAGGVPLPLPSGSAGTWQVAGSSARQVPMELKLDPPPLGAAKLDLLTLRWSLAAIGDFATAETKSVAMGVTLEQDDLELSIDNFEAKDGSKYVVTVSISRQRPLPDPPESLFQENRFELFDAANHPLRLTEQTNTLEGQAVRSKLNFIGGSGDGPPTRLKITYPRLRSERKLEIVFRDVPLPTARPE